MILKGAWRRPVQRPAIPRSEKDRARLVGLIRQYGRESSPAFATPEEATSCANRIQHQLRGARFYLPVGWSIRPYYNTQLKAHCVGVFRGPDRSDLVEMV